MIKMIIPKRMTVHHVKRHYDRGKKTKDLTILELLINYTDNF